MIARIWRGAVRLEDADAYVDYIRDTGLAAYVATPGNRGASMLRRDAAERSEIITYSLWDSLDSIRAFAGDDIDAAVYYPEDDRFLVERDDRVSHYEVAAQMDPPAAS
jgi:heme-degrading monooxygenase HmoA